MLNATRVPAGGYYSGFVELVQRKRSAHRPVLDAILPSLQGRFELLEQNRLRPELVPKVERSDAECEALESCYKDGEKFLRDLSVALGFDDDTQPAQLCPYCQLFPVRVWDHFLPSSKYPDFFAHPLNLIRACSECNEDKGAGRVVPVRETVHPYFDPLHIWYLKCTITHDGHEFAADYRIDPDVASPDYDPYVHEVVERHFRAYRLGRKFRAETGRKIVDFKFNMAKLAETGPLTEEDVAREIRYEVRKLLMRGEHANSWQLAFWEGMRTFVGLIDLINKDPVIVAAAAVRW